MWSKAAVFGWVALTILVVGYELWANFNGSPKTPTLTDVTVQYMPWWVTLTFIAWLFIHFGLNYATHQGWTSKGFLKFGQ